MKTGPDRVLSLDELNAQIRRKQAIEDLRGHGIEITGKCSLSTEQLQAMASVADGAPETPQIARERARALPVLSRAALSLDATPATGPWMTGACRDGDHRPVCVGFDAAAIGTDVPMKVCGCPCHDLAIRGMPATETTAEQK